MRPIASHGLNIWTHARLALLLLPFAASQASADSIDSRILRRAAELLHNESSWNRNDNRNCPENAEKVSLYCSLMAATKEVTGSAFHRTGAMEEVRAVIEDRSRKPYPHRLMGYNNDPDTRLEDLHDVLREADRRRNDRLAKVASISVRREMLLEPRGETSANISVSDIDRDGDLDIILAKGRHWPLHNRILLNDGKGGFTQARNLSDTADRTYTAAVGDLDGDGDMDIVVSNDRPDRKLVYLNDAGEYRISGTFGDPAWPTRNLTLADLNADGRPDIIAANRGSLSQICLNDGKGAFPTCQPIQSESATSIAAADLDSDGAVDLAIPHRDGGQSHVLWNNGKGQFNETTKFGPGDSAARAVAVCDVNSDGLTDLIVGDERQGVFLYLNYGKRQFMTMLPLTPRSRVPYAIVTADMNRDGKPDVVIGNERAPGSILLNDGTGKNYRAIDWNDGQGAVYGIAIGDLDKDGWPDIAAARSGAPNAVWFLGAAGIK